VDKSKFWFSAATIFFSYSQKNFMENNQVINHIKLSISRLERNPTLEQHGLTGFLDKEEMSFSVVLMKITF
jgi:hypothetical protein